MNGGIKLLLLLLCLGTAWAFTPQNSLTIAVSVVDSGNQPVPAVHMQVKAAGHDSATAQTNALGKALITGVAATRYQFTASKEGFETITREIDLSNGKPVALDLTLTPSLTHRESIHVTDTVAAVDQPAVASSVSPQIAKELPTRPATVADALPLIPGVIRQPGGALLISASAEHRSALIVNSADVTDPGTGQFGLTVPIDSVESLNVYQTPYLAEYGRFTAGLVSVETRRGGDKWNWELNDPLPEFRIRSYHLRGLKTATPRLNFEGPILARRLYISEGFEYEVRKTPVYTLPFPHNQIREDGLNSFTQLDWVMSERSLLTGTAHIAPRRFAHANIDYFNPEGTSPSARTHNYTGTLADRLTIWGGLLETTFSTTQFDVSVWGEGPETLIVTPSGNRGNYSAAKERAASRYSGAATYALRALKFLGTHSFKVGLYAAGTGEDGSASGHPVEVFDGNRNLLRRITFSRLRDFSLEDTETAFYWQDHWLLSQRFSVELGVRTEEQQISGAFRVAPRGGFAWSPFAHIGTVVRGGFGLFYDRVPLNIYAFNRYPDELITWYGPDGRVSEGPILFLNTLGQTKVRFPFVSQRPIDGNFSPHSANWSLQIEQPVSPTLRLRMSYLQNDAAGLAVMGSVPPDTAAGTAAYLLEGTGQSRYRQFEAMARLRAGEGREVFFSYVYSRARGNLNDFGTFLGIYPVAIIRPDQIGNLNGCIPNRFLGWGALRLTKSWRVAPLLEVRNGFPFSTTDAAQNYAGVPNSDRFPVFFSFDTRVSKDIQVNPKYAVRLSVSGFNLTNHFNPEAVHNNTADPDFGYFFGHRGRRFTLDFDVLF